MGDFADCETCFGRLKHSVVNFGRGGQHLEDKPLSAMWNTEISFISPYFGIKINFKQ